MTHGVEITIRDKSGKEVTYRQDFVPTQKILDYLELTPENYPDLDQAGWIKKNAEFSASIFDDKAVTAQALLNGVPSWCWDDFTESIAMQVLGIDPKAVQAENESASDKQ